MMVQGFSVDMFQAGINFIYGPDGGGGGGRGGASRRKSSGFIGGGLPDPGRHAKGSATCDDRPKPICLLLKPFRVSIAIAVSR